MTERNPKSNSPQSYLGRLSFLKSQPFQNYTDDFDEVVAFWNMLVSLLT